jgi:RES domain-containing protein
MRLWRLSGASHADVFDGGYGLLFNGRWNSIGHAVTYCSTSPALCVLEKLVHVEDFQLLPELVMLTYEVPDSSARPAEVPLETLPADWTKQEALTQRLGDEWHEARGSLLLRVPSAVLNLAGSPDVNIVINQTHPDVGRIKRLARTPFVYDPRLL